MKQSIFALLCLSSSNCYKYPDSMIHTVIPLNDNSNKPYTHHENWATNENDAAYLHVASHNMDDPVCPSVGCDIYRTAGANYTNSTKNATKRMGNYTAEGAWEISNVT